MSDFLYKDISTPTLTFLWLLFALKDVFTYSVSLSLCYNGPFSRWTWVGQSMFPFWILLAVRAMKSAKNENLRNDKLNPVE